MNGRFSRLPAAAVVDPRLSAEALRVLAALGIYADRHGYCYPAVTTIAELLNIDRRGVQRHLRKLIDADYVQREATLRATKGGWGRNRYWLRYPPLPVHESLRGTGSNAVPEAASSHGSAMHMSKDDEAMRHERATDAAPNVAIDAASGTAQTAQDNYPKEKKPNGYACVRSRNDGVIEFEDGSWIPDPETPSPYPAPSAQQKQSSSLAPRQTWKPPSRPVKPSDHVTDLANQLAIVPGFDRSLAWQAIFALPDAVLAKMETGALQVSELLAELRNLDLNKRARRGLAVLQQNAGA